MGSFPMLLNKIGTTAKSFARSMKAPLFVYFILYVCSGTGYFFVMSIDDILTV